MNTILIWLITITSFLIGYSIGAKYSRKQAISDVQGILNKVKMNNVKPGLVKRPDAKTLFIRNNPKMQEASNAMKETLKGIKELNVK
jgi:hypothetical protein